MTKPRKGWSRGPATARPRRPAPAVGRSSATPVRRAFTLIAALVVGGCSESMAEPAPELRVCSDPNNLPFSNERGEGFENAIAELLAREMGAELRYTWRAQRRGFIRNTLRAGACDLVMGVPTSYELTLPTRPYYRSSYVFVYRRDAGIDVRSFDDPALRHLRIGVQLIGDDYTNTPPAHALGARGIVHNVTGYSVYGDYSTPNPPARILDALSAGEIDVAVVWGPLAGYFAPKQPVALEIVPVSPQIDLPFLPFIYDISMGVSRGDTLLRDRIEQVIERRSATIDSILREFGVPRVGDNVAAAEGEAGP